MRSFASSAERPPRTDNSPESGNRIDMIMRMHVVLPAPLGPITPYSAPRGTTRSMASTATVVPKVFRTFLSSSAGGIGKCPARARSQWVAQGGLYHVARGRTATVDVMRLLWVPFIGLIALTSCGRASDANFRQFELQGQILAVRPERREVVIKHQDIKGFMPGLTMPLSVSHDT